MPWPQDVHPPLSKAEEHFLQRMLQRLRSLESRTRGLYAESLLCSLLPGAKADDYAAAACDLVWKRRGKDITIAVRTSGSRNSDHDEKTPPQAGGWSFPAVANWSDEPSDETRRCWADVAVLCFHDGCNLAEGWSFYVLSASQIEEFPAQRLTTANLAKNGYTPVRPDELAARVKAVGA